jgi:hypothetical protein
MALAGLLVVGALSGCGTGMDAQTNAIYDPGDGVNERGGDVDVLNALLVANPDGTGTVSAALLNNAQEVDEVTEIAVSADGEELRVDGSGLPVELPPSPRSPLNIEDEAALYVEDIEAGYFVTLSMQFQNAAPVEIEVPVVERGDEPSNDMYASVPTGGPATATEPVEPTEEEPTEKEPTEEEPTEEEPTE